MAESSQPLTVNVNGRVSSSDKILNQKPQQDEAADQAIVSSSKRQARSRLNDYQKQVLKRTFASSPYLTSAQQTEMAAALGISKPVLQNWFKNKRYRLRLKIESTENKTPRFNFPSAPVHFIENTAPQRSYVDVTEGFFYHQQCISAGEEQGMDYSFPPVTPSYYFP